MSSGVSVCVYIYLCPVVGVVCINVCMCACLPASPGVCVCLCVCVPACVLWYERVCVEVSSDLLVGLVVLVGHAGGIVINHITLHGHAIHGHTLRIAAVAVSGVHLCGTKPHTTLVSDSYGGNVWQCVHSALWEM